MFDLSKTFLPAVLTYIRSLLFDRRDPVPARCSVTRRRTVRNRDLSSGDA